MRKLRNYYISPTIGISLLISIMFGLFYLYGTMVEAQDAIFTRMATELDMIIETAYRTD